MKISCLKYYMLGGEFQRIFETMQKIAQLLNENPGSTVDKIGYEGLEGFEVTLFREETELEVANRLAREEHARIKNKLRLERKLAKIQEELKKCGG